ncbi:acetaldehyde dehydrogenase (acetylating) [Pseudonocardia spinosispora]|uniref:acetaldehyde dehydrogenase (acetylating) n=1 Tax=Pseudonocardia spinosispora TaxID=103441 RepID=UPI000417E7AB|nr:acetaldehyde dehydrogenase (acetylating) [Pseudonocardia spinosispora]
MTTKVAIIGTGHVGTDLLIKLVRHPVLEPVAVAGIDRKSPGLATARRLGVAASAFGAAGLVELDVFDQVTMVLDASTSAAHEAHSSLFARYGRPLVNLTPAVTGPIVVPAVNLDEHVGVPGLSLASCSAQATVPLVHAVTRVVAVPYAEVVVSIPSSSTGPGTRTTLDEFTEATTRAVQSLGGARRGRALTVLNPADPPMAMRATVHCIIEDLDDTLRSSITTSVEAMVATMARTVPGYRLKQDLQFSRINPDEPLRTLIDATPGNRSKLSVFLEVEGAGDHLGTYAGNLDITTTAAITVAARQNVISAGAGVA